ncbi:hypothetical protein TSAR_015874, partial [Trichomalopsis sarcophagae]
LVEIRKTFITAFYVRKSMLMECSSDVVRHNLKLRRRDLNVHSNIEFKENGSRLFDDANDDFCAHTNNNGVYNDENVDCNEQFDDNLYKEIIETIENIFGKEIEGEGLKYESLEPMTEKELLEVLIAPNHAESTSEDSKKILSTSELIEILQLSENEQKDPCFENGQEDLCFESLSSNPVQVVEEKNIIQHSLTNNECLVNKSTDDTQRSIVQMSSEPDRLDSKSMSLNSSSVAGSITFGNGYSQLEKLLASMHVHCIAPTTYIRNHDLLLEAFKISAEKSMHIAGELELEFAKKSRSYKNGMPCIRVVGDGELELEFTKKSRSYKNGMPCIRVVEDGIFLRRTFPNGRYDSNSGMAIIVEYHTQRILYIGIRNKYCFVCARAENQNIPAKKHICYKNYSSNKSASSIETDIITEGFKQSVTQHGLIYEYLIADGNSSLYNQILQDDPYKKYCISVKKIECTNHLLRNLCTNLKTVGKGRKKLSKWRKLIEDKVLRIRTAVTKATEYRVKENVPETKEGETNHVKEMEKFGIFTEIEESFSRISSNCLSLLQQLNNNIVERCNSVLAKIINGKRINYGLKSSYECRAYDSVTQSNTENTLSQVAVALNKTSNDIKKEKLPE